MCSVSAVHDYFGKNVSIHEWAREEYDEYQKIIRRLEKLDQRFKQPDCDDPSKAAWMQEVEERLAALEEK